MALLDQSIVVRGLKGHDERSETNDFCGCGGGGIRILCEFFDGIEILSENVFLFLDETGMLDGDL